MLAKLNKVIGFSRTKKLWKKVYVYEFIALINKIPAEHDEMYVFRMGSEHINAHPQANDQFKCFFESINKYIVHDLVGRNIIILHKDNK